MKVTCPKCKKPLVATEAHVGKRVACPACRFIFRISGGGPAEPPASPIPEEARRSLSEALYGALRFGNQSHLRRALATIEQVGSLPDRMKLTCQGLRNVVVRLKPEEQLDGASGAEQASVVRTAAAEAMSRIGDSLCVDALLECVDAEDRNVAVFALAADALAMSREKRGVEPLFRALGSSSARVAQAAAHALRSYADAQVDARLSAEEAKRTQQARREADKAQREAEDAQRQPELLQRGEASEDVRKRIFRDFSALDEQLKAADANKIIVGPGVNVYFEIGRAFRIAHEAAMARTAAKYRISLEVLQRIMDEGHEKNWWTVGSGLQR